MKCGCFIVAFLTRFADFDIVKYLEKHHNQYNNENDDDVMNQKNKHVISNMTINIAVSCVHFFPDITCRCIKCYYKCAPAEVQ